MTDWRTDPKVQEACQALLEWLHASDHFPISEDDALNLDALCEAVAASEPGGEAVASVIAELREAADNTDFSRADMRWFESMANRLASTQGVRP